MRRNDFMAAAQKDQCSEGSEILGPACAGVDVYGHGKSVTNISFSCETCWTNMPNWRELLARFYHSSKYLAAQHLQVL